MQQARAQQLYTDAMALRVATLASQPADLLSAIASFDMSVLAAAEPVEHAVKHTPDNVANAAAAATASHSLKTEESLKTELAAFKEAAKKAEQAAATGAAAGKPKVLPAALISAIHSIKPAAAGKASPVSARVVPAADVKATKAAINQVKLEEADSSLRANWPKLHNNETKKLTLFDNVMQELLSTTSWKVQT